MNNLYKITDERFSSNKTDFYNLIIEISFTRFRFLVHFGDAIVWLEDYFIGEYNDISVVREKVNDIINDHDFLGIRYWKNIKVISDFQIHTLIPKEDFLEARTEEYVKIVFPSIQYSDFEFRNVSSKKQTLVYGTFNEINAIFTEIYDNKSLEIISTISSAFEFQIKSLYNICLVSETFIDVFKYNSRTEQNSINRYFLEENIPSSEVEMDLYGELTPFGRNFNALSSKFNHLIAGRPFHNEKLLINFSDLAMQRYFTLFSAL